MKTNESPIPAFNSPFLSLKQLQKIADWAESVRAPTKMIDGKPHYVWEPVEK